MHLIRSLLTFIHLDTIVIKILNLNSAVKENVKTYLNEYKMVTDGINIIDGFIINFGIDFDITILTGYNRNEVLTNCINKLKTYFNIDKWTFNDTINTNEVELILANVEGVVSIPNLYFYNKCGGNYSPRSYNFVEAYKE